MNRFSRIMGVTLLEIMLVLAIAAMVIVMSIRYYSSATASQQANQIVAQIQAIAAGMDNLAVGAGTYAGIDTAAVTALVGTSAMKTPWGTSITVGGNSATTYTITVPTIPSQVCAAVKTKLTTTAKFTPTCGGTDLTVAYDSTK